MLHFPFLFIKNNNKIKFKMYFFNMEETCQKPSFFLVTNLNPINEVILPELKLKFLLNLVTVL